MDEIEEALRNAGLTGNEQKVYLELLRIGSSPVTELTKKIGLDRTLSYTLLNNLIKKGLVSEVIKGNKKFFNAAEPENLLNNIKLKEIMIKKAIEKLNSIKNITEPKQEIKIYDGKDSLRTFLRLLIKHKEICVFGATGKLYDVLFETEALAKELTKKNLSVKIITNSKYKSHFANGLKNIEIKYLDIKSEATTTIFGDYIAIHILTSKPLAITIKSKEISDSYKNHFNFLWNNAK